MTYKEAKAKADKYTEQTGKNAFVFHARAGFWWCSEWDRHYGSYQQLPSHKIIYSTFEGEYP